MEKEYDIDNDPTPDYTQGYNEGYLLAHELPDVAEALSKALGDSERAKGFQNGYEQFTLEKEKADREIYPDWLNRDNNNIGNIEPLNEKEARIFRDKEDIEPEKELRATFEIGRNDCDSFHPNPFVAFGTPHHLNLCIFSPCLDLLQKKAFLRNSI